MLCLDALLLLGMARLIRYLFKRKEEDEVAVASAGKRKTCVIVPVSTCEILCNKLYSAAKFTISKCTNGATPQRRKFQHFGEKLFFWS